MAFIQQLSYSLFIYLFVSRSIDYPIICHHSPFAISHHWSLPDRSWLEAGIYCWRWQWCILICIHELYQTWVDLHLYHPYHLPSRILKRYEYLAGFPYHPLRSPLHNDGADELAEVAHERNLDFVLFLGDFIYADSPFYPGKRVENYWRKYRQSYAAAGWKKVSHRTQTRPSFSLFHLWSTPRAYWRLGCFYSWFSLSEPFISMTITRFVFFFFEYISRVFFIDPSSCFLSYMHRFIMIGQVKIMIRIRSLSQQI